MKVSKRRESRSAGLNFFGRLSASISHEIKNKLAIIKEESGLITDLLAAAERGRPLDQARIKELAGKIAARVDDVDEIAKRLHRFAHSVDETRRTFEVSEFTLLAAGLHQRFAAGRKLNLQVQAAPAQVQITGDPFRFLLLFSLLLARILDAAEAGGALTAAVSDSGDRARLEFSGNFATPLLEPHPSGPLAELMKDLGVKLEEVAPGRLAFTLAKDLHEV